MRSDGRKFDALRSIKIEPHISMHAEGSVRIEMGNTHLLCTASVDSKVPKWLQGTQKGWVSAEYGMLPRSTNSRIRRDKAMSGGRTQEISRLIGRGLRAAVDLEALGERQVMIDCDVIQADGGTRTAAVTGGFVALALAMKRLQDVGELEKIPLKYYVAAISVGLCGDQALLDLNYEEDSTIDTDMNFIVTNNQHFVEVQGTAEGEPYSFQHLSDMSGLAQKGCTELFQVQNRVIGEFFPLEN